MIVNSGHAAQWTGSELIELTEPNDCLSATRRTRLSDSQPLAPDTGRRTPTQGTAPVHPLPDEWLTTKEAAHVARVQPVTIYRWFNRGLLSSRVGGSRRIRRADLESFFDNTRTVPVDRSDIMEEVQ